MSYETKTRLLNFRQHLAHALIGPQTLAFLPALTLGGYWFGGEGFLLFLSLLLPALFAVAGLFSGSGPAWGEARDGETGLVLRSGAERTLDRLIAQEAATGRTTAALALEIDDTDALRRQFGQQAVTRLFRQAAERVVCALRENDVVARLGESRFGVALGPMRRADLETMIQLSARLQAAIAEPYSVDAARVYVTASAGFCLAGRATEKTGAGLMAAAEAALQQARANGSGSIRSYSSEGRRRTPGAPQLLGQLVPAIEAGQIQTWFQPQVSAQTGALTGLQILTRWNHPEHGLILGRDFSGIATELGLQSQLAEIAISQASRALRGWDEAGLNIPHINTSLPAEGMSDPTLTDKLMWEIDRHELLPGRLCVGIPEAGLANPQNEMAMRNASKLMELGCKIDLDDFGTGQTSIATIRRFCIQRVRIGRSMVTRVDLDRDQRNTVAAILSMAENLNLDTLAEGVDTLGERSMMAQLGCGHICGFSVAKPLAAEDVPDWIKTHEASVPKIPKLGRGAG